MKGDTLLYDNIVSFLCCLLFTWYQDNDTTMDPFFDIEQHVLLGVANIFMQCLVHRVCHEYDAPIIGPTGKVTCLVTA